MLTFLLEMRQHRLAVHAVLDAFRVLLPDLENLSASIISAQIFQVRQQEGRTRKASSTACTASRASQQGCARPPDSIKLRFPSSPKLTGCAILTRVTMPYLVSSPALARHPSAHLLITRHPALAVLLRTAVARRGDALSSQPARQSCSCIRVCVFAARAESHTSCGGARQAEQRRSSWCSRGRCCRMERLLAVELAQHAHHTAHTRSPFPPATGPT